MNTPKANLRTSAPILLTFLGLGVIFYCIGYWLIFRLERATPLMMSIGLAAVVTCLIHRRPLSSLGLLWTNSRDQWASLFIPIGIALISYFIIWVFGFGEFNSDFAASLKGTYNLAGWNTFSILLFHVVLSATFSLCLSIPSIFGEEIAWRGFLVPELAKSMSFTNVAFVSGYFGLYFIGPS